MVGALVNDESTQTSLEKAQNSLDKKAFSCVQIEALENDAIKDLRGGDLLKQKPQAFAMRAFDSKDFELALSSDLPQQWGVDLPAGAHPEDATRGLNKIEGEPPTAAARFSDELDKICLNGGWVWAYHTYVW